MDENDDWCFMKIKDKADFCSQSIDTYSTQLVSVCNRFGFLCIAKDNQVVVCPSDQIQDLLQGKLPSSVIQKTEPVTHVAINESGSSVAVATPSSLAVHSPKNTQSPLWQVNLTDKVKHLEWKSKKLGVLFQSQNLHFYEDKNKLPVNFTNIAAFAFKSSSECVAGQSGNLVILDLATQRITQQSPMENFLPFSMQVCSIGIVAYGIGTEDLEFKLFSTQDLSELRSLGDSDLMPLSPPPSASNPKNLPVEGYTHYFESRDTFLVSSSVSYSVDVIYGGNLFYWDENPEDKAKAEWENQDFQHLIRGMGVITSYTPSSPTYTHTAVDTEYQIPPPPIVVFIGSNGKLYLCYFVDLRSDYSKDNLISREGTIKDVQEDSVQQSSSGLLGLNLGPRNSTFNLGGPKPAQKAPEPKQSFNPPKFSQLPDKQLSPTSSKFQEIENFASELLQDLKSSLEELEDALTSTEQYKDLYGKVKNLQVDYKHPKESLVDLVKSMQRVSDEHYLNKQLCDSLKSEEDPEKALDPSLKRAEKQAETRLKSLQYYLGALEKMISMNKKTKEQLNISSSENVTTGYFRVTRSLHKKTQQAPVTVQTKKLTEYVWSRLEKLTSSIENLNVKANSLGKKLRPPQEKRFAFDEVEDLECTYNEFDEYSDPRDIEQIFKGAFVCKTQNILSAVKSSQKQTPAQTIKQGSQVDISKIDSKPDFQPSSKQQSSSTSKKQISFSDLKTQNSTLLGQDQPPKQPEPAPKSSFFAQSSTSKPLQSLNTSASPFQASSTPFQTSTGPSFQPKPMTTSAPSSQPTTTPSQSTPFQAPFQPKPMTAPSQSTFFQPPSQSKPMTTSVPFSQSTTTPAVPSQSTPFQPKPMTGPSTCAAPPQSTFFQAPSQSNPFQAATSTASSQPNPFQTTTSFQSLAFQPITSNPPVSTPFTLGASQPKPQTAQPSPFSGLQGSFFGSASSQQSVSLQSLANQGGNSFPGPSLSSMSGGGVASGFGQSSSFAKPNLPNIQNSGVFNSGQTSFSGSTSSFFAPRK